MAFCGSFLHLIKKEIEDFAVGARIEKITEPSRDEIVLGLRKYTETRKLLISARTQSARVSFIDEYPENPKTPPMLCMLLRKKIGGGKILSLSQPGLERVLIIEIETVNELGDKVVCSLICEIMGRYSNIVLSDENGKVVDALRRVNADIGTERMILPGLLYRLPPLQNKLCLLGCEPADIINMMEALPSDMQINKGLLSVLQGVSPIICREAEFYARGTGTVHSLQPQQRERLLFFLSRLKDLLINFGGEAFAVYETNGKPLDFTFMEINQYGVSARSEKKESYSALLCDFYGERDKAERIRVRSADILKILGSAQDRISRKIDKETQELLKSADREPLRINADLITAGAYLIPKGAPYADLPNYFEEGMPLLRVKLNPALSAAANAQKYYKEYKKAKTAAVKLKEQIELARDELSYIESCFDELVRAENESELLAIREELFENGYIKKSADKSRKKQKPTPPAEYTTSGGFCVLVGRNNRANDELTLKTAKKNDIFFHTKNIPGSHTILVTDGKTPEQKDLFEAACIAAKNSKGRNSSDVPVDYTVVKNVSKPSGAKPGKVIYVNYKTLFADPSV